MHDFVQPRQRFGNDFFVKEQQRCQRLVLRCRRDMPFDRQMIQKRRNFRRAQLAWVSLPRKLNEPLHPQEIGFLGAVTEMASPDRLARHIEQPRRLASRTARVYVMVTHMCSPTCSTRNCAGAFSGVTYRIGNR